MRCFVWKHSGGKLHRHLDLLGGSGGDACRENIMWQELQQERLKIEAEGASQLQDWNMEQKNLESKRQTQEFEKRRSRRLTVSVLGVNQVYWKEQGEIRSNHYMVYYSGGERAERCIEIVAHKSIVRCDCVS